MKNHLNLNDHPWESNWIKYGTATLRIIWKCLKKRKKEGEEESAYDLICSYFLDILSSSRGKSKVQNSSVGWGVWWFHQNKAWEEKSRNSWKLFAIVCRWEWSQRSRREAYPFEYNLWYSFAFEPCKLNKKK